MLRSSDRKEGAMTGKTDFTEEEWDLLREAPPGAGLVVLTAQRGGSFRETYAMAKAYSEARSQHGASQLLDEIVSSKPQRDHAHSGSVDELKQHVLGRLREAVALLEAKTTPGEVDDYRRFVLAVTEKVAAAHREDGVDVSPAEQAAIDEISTALGGPRLASAATSRRSGPTRSSPWAGNASRSRPSPRAACTRTGCGPSATWSSTRSPPRVGGRSCWSAAPGSWRTPPAGRLGRATCSR